MADDFSATCISLDVIDRITDTIENYDSLPSDDVIVVLNEALNVIRELLRMLDVQRDG
ncbi:MULTISPECIES: hypothetical protein [unclassified Rhizobium]|jgi:hypothetical protein|uniref:hypothetical protein n=1 Tax=unclassified Rhizobium TaxID=2613769 RepID=UPI001AE41B8C|nr:MULTISPECIES: hypothetical protein [unclassified Rhizobium]MBP2463415.1 hypothetical protein [Rhizobium sp. PvP014]MBP2530810.1 hypothetical protein [Rhizobium sp. PvP099]